MVEARVVDVQDFEFGSLPHYDRLGDPRKMRGEKRYYLDVICSFDIETTNIRQIKQAVMFVWQFAFGTDVVVMGRTWDDYLSFLAGIRDWLPKDTWLVVYVHNLSFEFQFLSGIYHFWPDEVFALEARSILRCDMNGCIEYRCSMKLSNDSLDVWTRSLGVEHQKQSGEDFDYTRYRWSWTPLTEDEIRYCVYDVLGVVECVQAVMQLEGDDLATIPMTQTGFIRREVKSEMASLGYWYLKDLRPSYELFLILRAAFRGGNTHANRYYVGECWENVYSCDRSSSYPDVLCNNPFPVGKFIKPLNTVDPPELIRKGYAVVFSFKATDIHLKHQYWGFPYLSADKCEFTHGEAPDGTRLSLVDNGRILMAREVYTTVTDVDFRIIMEEYQIDGEIIFSDVWFARYGQLPDEFTRCVRRNYKLKTALKGTDRKREYQHAKEKVNACYGMAAQNPLKDEVFYLDVDLFDDVTPEDGDLGYQKVLSLSSRQLSRIAGRKPLAKKYKMAFEAEELLREKVLYDYTSSFLPYQWGVWCTAWARYELEIAMWQCMDGEYCRLIYIDTDSLYYEGPKIDFSEYNRQHMQRSLEHDAIGVDAKGVTHYMGVLEEDDPIDDFKTWGAKKYMYQRGDKITITIAGVNKTKGCDELARAASANGREIFDMFDRGFTFRDAGGTEAWYNDGMYGAYTDPETGKSVCISSNVYLQDGEYTLGTGGEYTDILEHFRRNPNFCELVLDNWRKSVYNKIDG